MKSNKNIERNRGPYPIIFPANLRHSSRASLGRVRLRKGKNCEVAGESGLIDYFSKV